MASEILARLTWFELLAATLVLLSLCLLLRPLKRKWMVWKGREGHLPSDWSLHRTVPLAGKARNQYLSNNVTPQTQKTEEQYSRYNRGAADYSPDSHSMKVLREEIADLRMEVEKLRAEVRALREMKTPEPLVTAQDVSPYYSDAMQLAMRGKDAESISRMCEISRAEADLVVSMAKSGKR